MQSISVVADYRWDAQRLSRKRVLARDRIRFASGFATEYQCSMCWCADCSTQSHIMTNRRSETRLSNCWVVREKFSVLHRGKPRLWLKLSECREESGENCAAARNVVDEDVFVNCVSAIAINSQTIQNGNAHRSDKVSV